MDFIRELIETLWAALAVHLQKVLPAGVFDGLVAKIPMPIED